MKMPWSRIDSDVYVHDKIVAAVRRPHGKEAVCVYLFSICWSAGQGTDGHVPEVILPVIHATTRDASLLVSTGLWEPHPGGDGWLIHNFAERQKIAYRAMMADLGRRGAKARWHADDSDTL